MTKYTITEYHGTQVHTHSTIKCEHENRTADGITFICDDCGDVRPMTAKEIAWLKSVNYITKGDND